MRNYPNLNNKYDREEWQKLKAKDWMLEALKKNPNYTCWGNSEDYMWKEGSGWDSAQEINSVNDLWPLDDLNELVNFYFYVHRANHECTHCEGSGLNKETKQISDDWYDFNNTGRKWNHNITEVEIEALCKAGRLTDFIGMIHYDEELQQWIKCGKEKEVVSAPVYPTPQQVNSWAKKGIGHDDINRIIAVKARAKHLGVYGHCGHCQGTGYIFDEDQGHLGLQMWMLHPRKGCSRGVRLNNIEENEMPVVIEYLKSAANRNAERFSKL